MEKAVELAQEEMYEAFNANNNDDELDIHCYREVPLGSHIHRRVCRPVFVDTATSRAGRDLVGAMRSACLDPSKPCWNDALMQPGMSAAQPAYSNLLYMAKRLDAEMHRLARENADVAKAVSAYEAKRRAYDEAVSRREK